ncbi:Arabinose efflux permease [Thermoplasmatales archaeon BRNA1]|nr:Arabinose efflux permease [Thermoplasmatales archaeon BRNA1]
MLISLIIVLNTFGPISTDMFLSDIPNMAVDLDTDPATMNMVLYGFMLSMAVSILLFGPFTDRYGRKHLLIGCLAEYVAASMIAAFVDNIYILVVFRVLQGIGAGGVITISTALIKDCFTGLTRAKVLNVISLIGVVGPLAAPIVGAYIISIWDWRMTFIAPGVVAALCLIPAFMLSETLKDEHRDYKGIAPMFHAMEGILVSPPFGSFLLMVTIFNMMFMGYLSVSSYIYEGMFGVSSTNYTLFLAAALLFGSLMMPFFARGSRSLGYRRMIPVFFSVMFAGAFSMFMVGDGGKYVFLLTFLPCMCACAAIRPYGMTVLMASHEGDNGMVSSLINFIFFLTGCIGMVVSTMSFWPNYVYGLSAIGLIACAIFLAMWAIMKATKYNLRALR